jgi:hypothetical protein
MLLSQTTRHHHVTDDASITALVHRVGAVFIDLEVVIRMTS